jgi:hypothetical protein
MRRSNRICVTFSLHMVDLDSMEPFLCFVVDLVSGFSKY